MFNWDAIVHEVKATPFEFEADGKKWRLPHVADLTVGQQLDADAGQYQRVFRDVLEVFDDDIWKPAGRAGVELVRSRHGDQIGPLRVAWLAHAGMEPGESKASSR